MGASVGDSFHYLQQGADYVPYELPRQSRFPPYEIPLTEAEEERASRYLAEEFIVSMREHGFIVPERPSDILPYCRQLHTMYNYEGLRRSGLNLIFDNFMEAISLTHSKAGQKWDDAIANLGIRLCDLEHQEGFSLIRNVRDLDRLAASKGEIGIVASMETATPIENELDRIDMLYGFGIRCIGITYNDANLLGSGLSEASDGGLTAFGRKAVRRMNRLGIVADISHCGPRTSLDVVYESEHPVMITHTGAKKLWDSPRMASDELLKACAAKGGVIGVCAAPNTTLTGSGTDHSIEDVMAHFRYIADLVGIDHVGIGSDTFYGDHLALQDAFDARLMLSESHGSVPPHAATHVRGAENPNEATSNIVRWLTKHGYSEPDIRKVLSGNAVRVLRRVL
ncbi:dipeptidase [Cohnella massiliensis]|uniref:dipeptidase n=1 Tax=Cohnella massiliensis TaxID=1816691 RepID=UPI0009BA29B2|nr:membrane dipeptidase [Cohnella massiliensis]